MKIFWSWQSDRHGNISRHLVRRALELAVASLKEDLAIEEPEREISLDHDRKGVPGSPDLANVILDKIRASDVFVADVTPVGATENSPPKLLMNPNVAIELGYALHALGDRRLIMVMNSAFGAHSDLPFDLRHKAGPICYQLGASSTNAEIKRTEKQLAGDLLVALREILHTLTSHPGAFRPGASYPGDPSRYFDPTQILVNRRISRIDNVTQSFTVPETPLLYLRIIPTRPTQILKLAEAGELLERDRSRLRPFDHSNSDTSVAPNEFGAIAFDANHERGLILSAIQLFLNRELWGFDSFYLAPTWESVPIQDVEKTFALRLRQYVQYMNERLGVPPPYQIEGGATNIKGYPIAMPERFRHNWGPIHQDNVIWSGTLANLDPKTIDAVLLKIFEAFFDAGAAARPDKLNGFPGEIPGTMPR